jgi:hypothetical protein
MMLPHITGDARASDWARFAWSLRRGRGIARPMHAHG